LDIAPTLSEYGVYVGNFKNCNSTLLRLKEENSAFTALVQRVDRTQGASLSALLSQPVNHISKLCTDIEVRSFIHSFSRSYGSTVPAAHIPPATRQRCNSRFTRGRRPRSCIRVRVNHCWPPCSLSRTYSLTHAPIQTLYTGWHSCQAITDRWRLE